MTEFIKPIGPIKPISFENLTQINPENILSTVLKFACIFLFYLAMYKISKIVISKTPGYNKDSKKIPIYHGISIVLVSILFIVFGWSMELLKGIIFMQTLLYASASDIQIHEVKDFVSVYIFITGFIGVTLSDIPMMILSSLFIGGMLFLCAMVSGNRLGGADVKLSAACAFLLGFSKSIAGLVIGLFLAIICNIYLSRKSKNKRQSISPCAVFGYWFYGYVTEGYFEQPEIMSDNLKRKLLQFGVPQEELNKFLVKGADYE